MPDEAPVTRARRPASEANGPGRGSGEVRAGGFDGDDIRGLNQSGVNESEERGPSRGERPCRRIDDAASDVGGIGVKDWSASSPTTRRRAEAAENASSEVSVGILGRRSRGGQPVLPSNKGAVWRVFPRQCAMFSSVDLIFS